MVTWINRLLLLIGRFWRWLTGPIRRYFVTTGRPYQACWQGANRVRKTFGRPLKVKRCCRKRENRRAIQTGRHDLAHAKCKVCGSQHWELTVDPGRMGLQIKAL
jgi:hypothetical protein